MTEQPKVTWYDGWNAYGYDVIRGEWMPLRGWKQPAG